MYRPKRGRQPRPTNVEASTTGRPHEHQSDDIAPRRADAIRTPISRVRSRTTWLITPNVPTAASINASPANIVAISIVNRCGGNRRAHIGLDRTHARNRLIRDPMPRRRAERLAYGATGSDALDEIRCKGERIERPDGTAHRSSAARAALAARAYRRRARRSSASSVRRCESHRRCACRSDPAQENTDARTPH